MLDGAMVRGAVTALDRALGEEEALGDGGAGHTGSDQAGHLPAPLRDPFGATRQPAEVDNIFAICEDRRS